MEIIETARLLLRPLEMSDLDEMVALYGDPDVMRYVGSTGEIRNREQTERSLKNLLAYQEKYGYGYGGFAAILRETNEFVGRGGLIHLDNTDEIEVYYALAKKFWGKNLATEMTEAFVDLGFGELGLQRIVGVTYPQNETSGKVLQKAGLKFEKTANFYNVEVNYYSINYSDWKANQPQPKQQSDV